MQRKGRKSLLLSLTNVQGIQGVQNGEEVQGARGAEYRTKPLLFSV